MDICNTFRYLGVHLCNVYLIFGDNEPVVNSASMTYTKLHKYHIVLSFHIIGKLIAAAVMPHRFMSDKDNPTDIRSKQ